MSKNKRNGPRILLLDVETAPILASVWGLFDQNIPLNMIEKDWHLLSYSAKWLDSDEIFYMDQRNIKNIEDDSKLLKGIWKLMNSADIIVGQNSNRFDIKKLNARFILNGMSPPSSYKKIDTMLLAKKYFAFTSNKLEYLTKNLTPGKAKSAHKKFPGFELWKECLKGNIEAWNEMEAYNKQDVVALQSLYEVLAPWDNTVNFNLYNDTCKNICKCGCVIFKRNGYCYTNVSKFQRYKCLKCGSETRGRQNLFSSKKKASIKVGTVR